MQSTPSTPDHRPSLRIVKRRDAALDRLEAHLGGLRQHLLALGMAAEASAVLTDLQLVADLRTSRP